MRNEITGADQSLEEFKKGEAWQNLQHLQEELDSAGDRLKKAETGLNSLILPFSGNLSKIKKLHESGRYTFVITSYSIHYTKLYDMEFLNLPSSKCVKSSTLMADRYIWMVQI